MLLTLWASPVGRPPAGTSRQACANADTPVYQLNQEAAEEAVLCLGNAFRVANGVPPLQSNERLRDAARAHAQAAHEIKWWAGGGPAIHKNPRTLTTPEERIAVAGYCAGRRGAGVPVGENGKDDYFYGDPRSGDHLTPRHAVAWWSRSDEHRKTLLRRDFRDTGVGIVRGWAQDRNQSDPNTPITGGVIYVQTFGDCPNPIQARPTLRLPPPDRAPLRPLGKALPQGEFQFRSYNFPDRYLRHQNFRVRLDPNVTPPADSRFRFVKGLAGDGTISLESANFPGHYLRHRAFEVWLDKDDGSALFKEDASFHRRSGLADPAAISLEAKNQPGRYLRHRDFLLYVEPPTSTVDRADATYHVLR